MTQKSTLLSINLAEEGITIDKVEQEMVRQAYAYTGGNITRAAGLIGMARATFRRKLTQMQDAPEPP